MFIHKHISEIMLIKFKLKSLQYKILKLLLNIINKIEMNYI